MKKLIGAVSVLAVTGAAFAVSPADAGGGYKQIGRESSSGDFATVIASGTAKSPRAIYVAVKTSPRQKADMNWTVVCSKGMGAGSKSGDYSTSSSAKRKIRLPMSNPSSCTVSAGGQLSSGGKITVTLYKR